MEREHYVRQHAEKLESVYFVDSSSTGFIHKSRRAVIYKAINKTTNKERAVQIFPGEVFRADRWKPMVDVMKKLDHPHICRLLEFFVNDSKVAWIIELPTGRDLLVLFKTHAGQLVESAVSVICRQMVGAVSHLHDAKVCHAELTPQCFFLTRHFPKALPLPEICVKLIDCGRFAVVNSQDEGDDSEAISGHGPDHYVTVSCRAPEQIALNGKPGGHATVGSHTDVWALGAILYFGLSSKWPSKVHQKHEHYVHMEPESLWQKLSSNCNSFIKNCLHFKATDRPALLTLQESYWMKDATKALHKAVEKDKASKRKDDQLPSGHEIFDGLTATANKSDMERIAAIAFARQLPESSLPRIRQLFEEMDTSGDGRLQVVEFVQGLKKLGQQIDDIEKITAILEKVDVDGSGCIEYTEFLAMMVDLSKQKDKNHVKGAFQVFDTNGDGNISMNEVKEMMGAEAARAFDSIDVNNDGQLDAKEFQELLK